MTLEVKRINSNAAIELMKNENAAVVDIRDEQSFAQGHIESAFHLTNGSITQFMNENDFEKPVIVCCYHGVSSLSAAQYLLHQGFEDVYSLDGGFEEWRKQHPFTLGN